METKKYSEKYDLDKRLADLSYDVDLCLFRVISLLPDKKFEEYRIIDGVPQILRTYTLSDNRRGIIRKDFQSTSMLSESPVSERLSILHLMEESLENCDETKTFDELSD